MAGKYHRNFEHYGRSGGGHTLAPGQKGIRAYAEGYDAYRSGAAKANPHPVTMDDESDFQSWEYGWQDGERGDPATHVGGPDAVALPPEPDPEPLARLGDPALTRPWAEMIRHADLDALARDLDAVVPADWDRLTVAEKRGFFDAIYPAP